VAVLEESADIGWHQSIAFHPRLPVLATLGEQGTIIRIWELNEAPPARSPLMHHSSAHVWASVN
jgi:hypothetical protein